MKKKHAALLLTTLMMLAGCGGTTDIETPTDKVTEGGDISESLPDTSLTKAKEEALAYLNSIDTSLYRDEEKTELETTIATLKEALNSEDQTVASITSALESFKTYLATLKTKADYEREEEEERAKELKAARDNKIAEATVKEINQYRSEEKKEILALQTAEIEKINALTTKEEIEAYSLEEYQTKIAAFKTNASYTMDEMVSYHPYASKWDLVNEHAFTWTRGENGVNTEAVGYFYDGANTYDDVTFTMTVDAVQDTSQVGILLGHNSEKNNGFDGYFINIRVESDKNHQYVQVWNISHGYSTSDPADSYHYLHGWTYETTGNKVLGTTFRIEKQGSTIGIYDEKEYQKNPESATRINVDLTENGTRALKSNLHFGMINWDGSPATVTLNSIVTDDERVVDSVATAKFYAEDYLKTVDLSKYRETEKAAIEAKKNELVALYTAEDTSYQKIIDKMNEMKEFVKTQKTAADYQAEEDAKNLSKVKENKIISMFTYDANAYSAETATKVLAIYNEAKDAVNALTSIDAVNAFDFTSYQTRIDALGDNVTDFLSELKNDPTQSSWDLVQQHAAQWGYDGKKLTLNSVAWQMGKSDYSDFDMVVNFNSTNAFGNAFDTGEWRSIIVRGSVTDAAFSGYVINFCNKDDQQYVQVIYAQSAFGYTTKVANYIGGWVYGGKINDATIRISLRGNHCYLYDEAVYATEGTNAAKIDVDLTGGGAYTAYSSGKIGAVCWSGSPDGVKTADLNFKKLIRC